MKNIKKPATKPIGGRVSIDVREAFLKVAKEEGYTPSKMLSLILTAFVAKNKPSDDVSEPETPASAKIDFYLGVEEKKKVFALAKNFGQTPSRWMRNLTKAQLHRQPQFTDQELAELKEANRQLAALGKNINQIARKLNTSLEEAHLAKAIELAELRAEIEEHRRIIKNLVVSNLRTWGVTDDEA